MTIAFRTGNGRDWLDLLATNEGRYRAVQHDTISSPHALRAWLRSKDIEPTGRVGVDDVGYVAEARETMHRLAVAGVTGHSPAAGDVRHLDRLLAADAALRLTGGATSVRVRRPVTVAQAVGRLAREAVGDLAGRGPGTLRACGDDTCSGIFLDTTGRRRWCSDERCGNRMRVRAHRARAEV
ncbi:MAG TPA: CGNR zinc finger domain-containing protein [Jatrophihabitans sp.]|nr:CGNR zinc finger domain-containing protein [Jatrophihabitans sp.]